MTRLLRIAATSLLLASCMPTEPGEADELRRAMETWEAGRPSSYEVVLQRSTCECMPEWLVPIRLTVRGQTIVSIVTVETGEPVTMELYHAMTVDELFTLIDRALDRGAFGVSATYDRVYGYPTSIHIDEDREMVDDQIVITARELAAID